MDLYGLMRDRPGDRSNDCPLQIKALFVWDRGTDGPLQRFVIHT